MYFRLLFIRFKNEIGIHTYMYIYVAVQFELWKTSGEVNYVFSKFW